MTAPGTRGLCMVAMVGHEVRCGEGFDGGTPLGGVWHISARSVHAGLPEEKRWGAVVEKRSIALSRANAESLLQCPVFTLSQPGTRAWGRPACPGPRLVRAWAAAPHARGWPALVAAGRAAGGT